jgi:hypothetical protein
VLEHRDLTKRIIGLAIEVHRLTGPGLLESVYTACQAFELEQAGIPLLRQVSVPVFYKGLQMPLEHVHADWNRCHAKLGGLHRPGGTIHRPPVANRRTGCCGSVEKPIRRICGNVCLRPLTLMNLSVGSQLHYA